MNFYCFDNLHNFTGYTYDETLDLHFAQNHFYDSDSKRFTQEDPIKDGTNWYGYVEHNPLMFVDPLGTSTVQSVAETALAKATSYAVATFVKNAAPQLVKLT